jgi:hypothetical protein
LVATLHPLDAAVLHYWTSPTGGGSGDGSSTNSPKKFTNFAINTWLTNTSSDDLTIHFIAGDYLVGGTNMGNAGTSPSITPFAGAELSVAVRR